MSLLSKTESTRVVLQYYLYRAVANPGFIQPIYIPYLLFHDLTFAQIGVIGAIQSVVIVGGEVPTGYIGDRIGRRNSLVVAQVLFIALFSGAAGTTSAYVQPIGQESLRSSLGALLDAYNLTEAASLGSGVLADYADPFAVAAMGDAFLLAGFATVSSTTMIHEPSTQTSNTVPAPE